MLKMSCQEGGGASPGCGGQLELGVSLEILTWSGRFCEGGVVDISKEHRAGSGGW